MSDPNFFKRVWHRVRTADSYDWMFGVLFGALGIAITTILYVTVFNDEPEDDFAPTSYVVPARVIDSAGIAPVVDGLPAPSMTVEDMVPTRLDRIMDCAVFDCAEGAMSIEVDVYWVRLNTDATIIDSVTVVEDFQATFVENEDYVRGALTQYSTDLTPFSIPDEVVEIAQEGPSVWRIDSVVTIDGRQEAAWATEAFHLAGVDFVGEQQGQGPRDGSGTAVESSGQ